jgi:leucyl-tRNA synthetase
MMEFTNLVTDEARLPSPDGKANGGQGGTLPIDLLQTFLLVLAPFAPHVTEELWSRCNVSIIRDLKHEPVQDYLSIHQQRWPTYDQKYLVEDTVTVVVQVNGKLRDSLQIDIESASIQEKVEAISKSSEKVKKYLDGVNIRKIIFVPGRIINFVVG